MRFPAQKAGVFSRFLTICCGRYSFECSPPIFYFFIIFFLLKGLEVLVGVPGLDLARSWHLLGA